MTIINNFDTQTNDYNSTTYQIINRWNYKCKIR